jgi:hypothetical protein
MPECAKNLNALHFSDSTFGLSLNFMGLSHERVVLWSRAETAPKPNKREEKQCPGAKGYYWPPRFAVPICEEHERHSGQNAR